MYNFSCFIKVLFLQLILLMQFVACSDEKNKGDSLVFNNQLEEIVVYETDNPDKIIRKNLFAYNENGNLSQLKKLKDITGNETGQSHEKNYALSTFNR